MVESTQPEPDESAANAAGTAASHAQTLFFGWMMRRLAIDAASADPAIPESFERLCAMHPAAADELRRLEVEFAAQASLPSGGSLSQRIEDTFGPGIDPHIVLDPDLGPSAATDASSGAANAQPLSLPLPAKSGTRYRVGDSIAQGGMGAILRVFDEDLRRYLAMKVMLGPGGQIKTPASKSEPHSLSRFLEEAQITAQLDHPGIVPVHELGLDAAGRVFFTMKLVKGRDLRTIYELVFRGEDGWNETRALGVLLKVCEAMAYAHTKGVIHRDLKPGNVMVGGFGEVYVMDWGLARVLGREDRKNVKIAPEGAVASDAPHSASTQREVKTLRDDSRGATPDSPLVTMDGDVVGTPAYMAPEQARGEIDQLSPRSDVYAIGAMLYHLLAREMPFVPKDARLSMRSVLLRVIEGAPHPLVKLRPDAPAELVAICEKAMARDPQARYADTLALGDDLRAYLEDRVVRAHRTGALVELTKWVRRNRATAIAAAAALVALVVGLAVTVFLFRRSEEQRQHVLRLADVKRLEDVCAEMDALWPARPQNAAAIESWLARSSALVTRLPAHEATLAELRSMGTPIPNPRQAQLDALRQQLADPVDANGQPLGENEVLAAQAQVKELAAAIASAPAFRFADPEADWWHATLAQLCIDLRAFAADDRFGRTLANVRSRLDIARTIEDETIGRYRAEWDAAIAAIRSESRYGGLDLAPQIGLVPLGRDPDSGLFEFWHVESGARPERDADGRIVIADAMGIVLVLLPGATYLQGAQSKDPDASNYDPLANGQESDSSAQPVAVTLDPFFLSKYELTQAQWEHLTGGNPSAHRAGTEVSGESMTLAHPVQQVSWNQCTETLRRVALALPTEAQWEYGCRAGTSTPWWTGPDSYDLDTAGNVADLTAKQHAAYFDCDTGLEDGHAGIARVGSFRANAFGLHDVIGNVAEWCRDGTVSYDAKPRAGDGERVIEWTRDRMFRGGSFSLPPFMARSSVRSADAPELGFVLLGLRPSRPLETAQAR